MYTININYTGKNTNTESYTIKITGFRRVNINYGIPKGNSGINISVNPKTESYKN